MNDDNDIIRPTDSLDTLENSGTVMEDAGSVGADATAPVATPPSDTGTAPPTPRSPRPWQRLVRRLRRANIYLLLFLAVIGVAVAILVLAALASRHSSHSDITNQNLSPNALKQLANSDVTVGDPKQILNVQSNAVFAGKVLIRDSLEVAGPIQVGGSLNLPGITVSGNSLFDQVQVNKGLGIGGDAAVQGQLTVQKGLSVAGNGTFNGTVSATQLMANALQLGGDLTLTHHIAAGGATPAYNSGSNLGGGGTVSLSGSDTAGTVTVNTGSGPSAGCFVAVTFAKSFNATPHVLITPVGSAAAGLAYYVNRSSAGFSICSAGAPPAGSNFGFDYFVLD